MNKVQCVQSHESGPRGEWLPAVRWCAVRGVAKEGDNSVSTLCNYYVSLPTGLENKVPTCTECLKKKCPLSAMIRSGL